jgi:Putative lumazine-binding
MINPEIQSFIDDYFEVIHAQDMELFDRVFHSSCCLYSAQGGELVVRPYAVYRDQVANRQSPKELGNPRNDKVLMVDQLSDNLALVKVQLEMFGGVMQDYLNIVYLDGQWVVMAKMYERVGDAA